MDLRPLLTGFALCTALLCAEPESPAEAPLSPKQDAVEQMLAERDSPEAMEKAVTAARKLGVSEQAILEARFLYHVDRAEDAELAALLPQFVALKGKFKISESEIFGSEDDWLAVTEYVQALDSLQKGDKDGFKRHITEAFWLSPKQGAAFAPHIDRIRLMDAMKDVKVDFGKTYSDIMTGKQISLGEMIGGRKGILLHFWSPMSTECEATLGDFLITAEHLTGKDLAVASILPETTAKVAADAKAMLEATGKKISGAWIVDSEKDSVSVMLRVQSVPVVVLVSAEGRVLFNGHPTDDEFWNALAKINPEIDRPEMREGD